MQLKKIHKSPIKHFLSNNDSIVHTASNELHAGYGSFTTQSTYCQMFYQTTARDGPETILQ